jgi:hypothetical protein
LTTYCDVNYIADLDDCRSKISFFCSWMEGLLLGDHGNNHVVKLHY